MPIGEQANIISHLTAQLQGINWLVSEMKVSLDELINEDLLFNVCQGIKIFNKESSQSEENPKNVRLFIANSYR